jgi:hypothetical protein
MIEILPVTQAKELELVSIPKSQNLEQGKALDFAKMEAESYVSLDEEISYSIWELRRLLVHGWKL